MSNPSSAVGASKIGNLSPQTSSPSQSQGGPSSSVEGYSQRRSGGLGSFGAGSTSRTITSSARSNQSHRKQHRNQKRPRLADEDAIAESAAMRSATSRKGQTSITHLMNFSLPPRPQYHHGHGHPRNNRHNPTWGLGSGYHAIDKARYVHANYRFIVNPTGDYHAQSVDADVHLDWNLVLQILASAQTQSASCPICLSTPVAPRMARCGHIFCLPCLLRYMHATDDSGPTPEKRARSKKCPICWDSIYTSETRPVRWYVGQEGEPPHEGWDVVLRLVMRQPGSTLALPRDGADGLAPTDDIPWHFAAEVMDYARVMKGTEDYMISQFDLEIKDLQKQEQEDEVMFDEGTEWTQKAMRNIKDAKERARSIGNPPSMPRQPVDRKPKKDLGQSNRRNDQVDVKDEPQPSTGLESKSSAESSTSQNQAPTPNESANVSTISLGGTPSEELVPEIVEKASQELPVPTLSGVPPAQTRDVATEHRPADSPYYFYQALLHYYLSPLDIRILKVAFGNFAAFPATILPRVERVSTGHVIDDELRKRTKYLTHLPYGCEVGFLECDWTDVVSPEVLKNFMPEIERRRKRNKDKESREEKERMRAEKEEDDKRWAAARRRRPSTPHESFSEGDFRSLTSGVAPEIGSSSTGAVSESTSPPWPASRAQHGSSFASLASPSTSPSTPRTVWGTTAVAPTSPTIQALPHEHDIPDNDGWLQGWERDLLREDDNLVAQVQAVSLNEGASKPGPSRSQKKKSKKITLMSTTARRGA
ncbi:MAG: hypothetical protein M1819_001565 [Sarea resinae]|nr:MAG: hypothetical protein M1819_001565 [Sarea resinae]